jgi:drug/metabolite transporter (DMT)-like permease
MIFIFIAALLWGTTNPLLKRYSKGLAADGSMGSDIKFLLKKPKYLVAQILNLCGSVSFFWGLRNVDVSVGSIAANSMAFVITTVVSIFVLREGALRLRTGVGMLFVLIGTAVCTVAQSGS